MNPLISILHHGHCRSTHHFFAVDSLPHVRTEAGNRLTKILLRHHSDYLRGAKDPDTRFRDFQNHVVHVTDGYWGGAPRVAHQWYDRLQKYLQTGKLKYAAHAAGVLSHYFTDPMMPLHTEQCAREKILHRPIEWSVTKSYREIFELWHSDRMRIVFEMSDQSGWLGEAILHGARYANQYYMPLLETYDLGRGRKNPTEGLSLIAKQSLAELFGLAITGWARVLDRAAEEAEVATGERLPEPSVAVSAILLSSKVPLCFLGKRISNRTERLAVDSLIREFEQTGGLRDHLPDEVDIVQRVVRVHQDERNWLKRREQLRSKETTVTVETTRHPQPATVPMPTRPTTFQRSVLTPRLKQADPLERAPSIGPKTAARFAQIDIITVGDFLVAAADEVTVALDTRWINGSTIGLWQRQTTLMCEIPSLSALDSQLIAGAGYENRQAIMDCQTESLHQHVTDYAATSAGRRYLRGGVVPNRTDVAHWIDLAQRYDSQLLRSIHHDRGANDGTSESRAA